MKCFIVLFVLLCSCDLDSVAPGNDAGVDSGVLTCESVCPTLHDCQNIPGSYENDCTMDCYELVYDGQIECNRLLECLVECIPGL